jgi:branched-chain amino acid transport system ATP-binding protein
MLSVEGLDAGYGGSQILWNVDLTVPTGQVVCLMGRNGVGKTTLLKTIMGLLPARGGRIVFDGVDVTRWSPDRRARAGVGYVPQGREIFPHLTVEENLRMSLLGCGRARDLEDALVLFPTLRPLLGRKGGVLSGGEQQMLTMCRTLMGDPELVIIDEPTEGLAPKLVTQVAELLDEIARRGVSILLVEQKLTIALKISHRLYVMGHGRIVFEGTPADLAANEAVRKERLEV